MKSIINKLSCIILRPIFSDVTFFICILALSILPQIIYDLITGNNLIGIGIMSIKTIHIYFFNAYIFSTIHLVLNKLTKMGGGILYGIIYLVITFDIFLIILYEKRIAPIFIKLIFETNITEAKGFLTIIPLNNILVIIALFIIIITSNIIIEKRIPRLKTISNFRILLKNRIYKFSLPILATIIVFINIIGLKKNITFIYAYIKAEYTYEMREIIASNGYYPNSLITSFGLLFDSIYCTLMLTKDIDVLNKTLSSSSAATSSYRSSNIIWIIGESFNKHHSSLYGYPLPTNEKLQKEVSNGNLFIFTDVLTPNHTTAFVMQSIFSLKSQDDNNSWAKTPLIPKIFKDAGYRTAFFSNQEKIEEQGKGFFFQFNLSSNFLADKNVINKCFDYSHNKTFKYDHELILDSHSSASLDFSQYNFHIYHLLGQHFDYKDRYPDSETFFHNNNYIYRENLSNTQKKDVAKYDNATKYNDKVISSIIDMYRNDDVIIIYSSDHGEEIHDYRNFVGRGQSNTLNAQLCKYIFEIPFIVWVSDKYKKTHIEIVQQLAKATDYPFMIDDMPHLLMDLAGITCDWYNPTRSIINESFNLNRTRLLLESKYDYNSFMINSNDSIKSSNN